MVSLGIREELRAINKGKHMYLPPAAYTLSIKEKYLLLCFFMEFKFQRGTLQSLEPLYL